MICLLLTVVAIHDAASEEGHGEGCYTTCNYHPEEVLVTNSFLYVTCYQTRENHAESHETGADSIVRSLELTLREEHHIHHISGEAEAIAELLNCNSDSDIYHVGWQEHTEVNETQAWQRHRESHPPECFLQAYLRNVVTSKNTTEEQENHTDSAIYNAQLLHGHAQTSSIACTEQEWINHLHQKALWQTIEKHECDSHPKSRFGEIGSEGFTKTSNDIFGCGLSIRFIGVWTWREEHMPYSHDSKDNGGDNHGYLPCHRHISLALLDSPIVDDTRDSNECRVTEYVAETVEYATPANHLGLNARGECQHIETISCDVVSSTGKRHNDEGNQYTCKEFHLSTHSSDNFRRWMRNRENGQYCQSQHEELHSEEPPTFGFDQIYEWCPQELQCPREVKQCGEE